MHKTNIHCQRQATMRSRFRRATCSGAPTIYSGASHHVSLPSCDRQRPRHHFAKFAGAIHQRDKSSSLKLPLPSTSHQLSRSRRTIRSAIRPSHWFLSPSKGERPAWIGRWENALSGKQLDFFRMETHTRSETKRTVVLSCAESECTD